MFHTHGRQQLKCKGEAEPTLVHPVDEHLHIDHGPLGLEAACQLLVGQLLGLAQFLDERLGAQVVKGPDTRGRAYIFFHLRAWYERNFRFGLRKSIWIYG